MTFDDEIEILYNKALFYGSKFEFTKAVECLIRALQLNTDNFHIWDLLSKYYLSIGDYEQAGLCKDRANEVKNREKKEKISQQLYV